MEVIFIQVICLATLFIAMTLFGIIPVLILQKKVQVHLSEKMTIWISFCNCVAGGVFLGMCFLGLFPYVHEKFSEVLQQAQINTSFPVTEFVIIMGFFIIFLIEQVVMDAKKLDKESRPTQDVVLLSHTSIDDDRDGSLDEDESYIRLLQSDAQDQELCDSTDTNVSKMSRTGHRGNPELHFHRHGGLSGHCDNNVTFVIAKSKGLRHLILLLAISVHSLFEGMALGLQSTSIKVMHLFVPVLFHELLVALALGVNIAKMNLGVWKSLQYILIVTGSIPIGILLGLMIRTAPGFGGILASAILQGIAAGIFIHVTFMELIPEELSAEKYKLAKVVFFFIGFLIMALVNFALGDH